MIRTALAGGPFRHEGRLHQLDGLQLCEDPVVGAGDPRRATPSARCAAPRGWATAGSAPARPTSTRPAGSGTGARPAGRGRADGRRSRSTCGSRRRIRTCVARYATEGFDRVVVWADQVWPANGDLATKRAALADAADRLGVHPTNATRRTVVLRVRSPSVAAGDTARRSAAMLVAAACCGGSADQRHTGRPVGPGHPRVAEDDRRGQGRGHGHRVLEPGRPTSSTTSPSGSRRRTGSTSTCCATSTRTWRRRSTPSTRAASRSPTWSPSPTAPTSRRRGRRAGGPRRAGPDFQVPAYDRSRYLAEDGSFVSSAAVFVLAWNTQSLPGGHPLLRRPARPRAGRQDRRERPGRLARGRRLLLATCRSRTGPASSTSSPRRSRRSSPACCRWARHSRPGRSGQWSAAARPSTRWSRALRWTSWCRTRRGVRSSARPCSRTRRIRTQPSCSPTS